MRAICILKQNDLGYNQPTNGSNDSAENELKFTKKLDLCFKII